MRTIAIGLGLAAALAATVQADARSRRPLPVGAGTANPSALVAEEIAFARMAREKGQWKAFAKFADDEALMFVPQEVQAQIWLKRQEDPAAPVQWEPHQVWMSCDGTLGVTKGAWHKPDGTVGWYTTIWKRQKKGEYRWVLDHGDTLPSAPQEPEMLAARVAKCGRRPDAPPAVSPPADARTFMGGNALDGTLRWHVTVLSGNDARSVSVEMWNGTAFETIVQDNVTPQG
ncbi:hypothetical protein [Novosphingobium resinovorum]|uniref:hypothetical protein n=1 Tax=Novosphingobium resinovorum TaxID=158500 RepID=UPI002ED5CCB7|nr:hypothetical protein [Novosphingobium resinovorum]